MLRQHQNDDNSNKIPFNEASRESLMNDPQQNPLPFNNINNNPYPFNSYENKHLAQQNDFGINQYSIIPRIGPQHKTIIIKDEKGNEISRIMSARNSSILPQRSNSFVTPVNELVTGQIKTVNLYPPVQNSYNPLVVQPQLLLQHPVPQPAMVTSVPILMHPPIPANPFGNKMPIITQTIPEEQINYDNESKQAHYTTLEK